jgi:hypothetical protein
MATDSPASDAGTISPTQRMGSPNSASDRPARHDGKASPAPSLSAPSAHPNTANRDHPRRFKIELVSVLVFGLGIILRLAIEGIPDKTLSGFLGRLVGTAFACFGIVGFVSMVTWYVSRKSQVAATTAFVLAVPLLIVLQLVGQWRIQNYAAASPIPPSASVQSSPQFGTSTEITEVRKRLDDLQKHLEWFEELAQLQKSWVDAVQRHDELRWAAWDARRQPYFSVSNPAFVSVETDTGILFVSCERVEPYLTGYRLNLSVGNPHLITISGGTINFTFGRAAPEKTADPAAKEVWQKSLRKQDCTFADSLLPGAWTKLAVTLPKVKAEELEYVTIGIDTSRVSLNSPGK